jgi:hypothetical protein
MKQRKFVIILLGTGKEASGVEMKNNETKETSSADTRGNCYICGAELGKIEMHSHILNAHPGQQTGYLLKVEGEGIFLSGYWLYIDVPLSATFSTVDNFLRKIWMECCEHESAFYKRPYIDFLDRTDYSKFKKNHTWKAFLPGSKIGYEYDPDEGYENSCCPTEVIITVLKTPVKETAGKIKNDSVRLLARNITHVIQCSTCGKPAIAVCMECSAEIDKPFFCESCLKEHTHEGDQPPLPITNSPRLGVCRYDGKLDVFAPKATSF